VEIFCNFFTEYVIYAFSLHLFSFFYTHNVWVWSFNGVLKILLLRSYLLSIFLCFYLSTIIPLLHLQTFTSLHSISEVFDWVFYLSYWTFHFQNFNLIFPGFLHLYWITFSYPVLSSLLHSAVYLNSLSSFNSLFVNSFNSFSCLYMSSLILLIILIIALLNPLFEIYSLHYCLNPLLKICNLWRRHTAFVFSYYSCLCCDLCIWGQVFSWRFDFLCLFREVFTVFRQD
jgi:hypothetical protein